MIWTITLAGSPPCWIRRMDDPMLAVSRATFQWKEAAKFKCREDADREILRLRLSGAWSAVEYNTERE